MEIWYCDIQNISEADFQQLLQECPPKEQEEILRYRFLKDRLFRLVGRRMVALKYRVSYEDFRRSETGKPYLIAGGKFNISHAGNTVAVVFSHEEVGIDIEVINDLDTNGMSTFFHLEEREELTKREGAEHLKLFYRIWTRKEAFLKAIGQGITKGLNEFNCMQDQVQFENRIWNIESLNEIGGCALAVCSNSTIEYPEFKELLVDELRLGSSFLPNL